MSAQNEIILEPQNINPEPIKILPPTFYEKVGDNLTLDLAQLIHLVISRYKLLKEVEFFSRRKSLFYRIIHKKIPIDLSWTNDETVNNDIASHFLLALIMCNTSQDLRWFIQQESLLYYARIRKPNYNSPKYDIYKILCLLGMKLTLFDPNQHKDIDINKIRFRRKNSIDEKIYFINFLDGINLLPQRAYYLHKGNLYILEKDLPKLFFKIFQQNQYNIINKIKINAEEIKKDRRIKEIIISFEKEKEKYNFQQAIKITKGVNSDEKLKTMYDVDTYSEKCFPLCMCLIQRHLNKFSHLMHVGRLQYTLFLKGAGLPIEEALKFYQKKYEKKCSLAKFNKQYAYYIRHAYGLEGRKANYMPYNCDRLISFNVPMGNECHGCPFKNYNADNLRSILTTCNLRDSDIEDILSRKKNKEYKICCVKYFQGKFIGSNGEGIGMHPNQYFSSAMRILKGGNKSSQNSQISDIQNSNIKNINNNINEDNIANIKTNNDKDTNKNNNIINENINIFDDDIDLDENEDREENESDNKNKNTIDNTIDESDGGAININKNENNKEEDNISDSEEDNNLDIDIDDIDFF